MLSETQLNTMLQLQAGMNSKVDPAWVEARYPYLRAVVIEGSEAIEHHGWKWWKKQDMDLPQLQMELIDIWHFLLSEILLRRNGNQELAQTDLQTALQNSSNNIYQFDGTDIALDELHLVDKLELLIAVSARRKLALNVFATIMIDCQLSWLELYRQYVGKNVLNFFRQDYGYKEGTYLKTWDGREDNEYLVEIINKLDANEPDYQEKIYQALASHYPAST